MKNILVAGAVATLSQMLGDYLAQKFCFWTGIIFTRVYVSVCVYVCVCVCVNLYIDYLKKFLTDFDEIWQDDVG